MTSAVDYNTHGNVRRIRGRTRPDTTRGVPFRGEWCRPVIDVGVGLVTVLFFVGGILRPQGGGCRRRRTVSLIVWALVTVHVDCMEPGNGTDVTGSPSGFLYDSPVSGDPSGPGVTRQTSEGKDMGLNRVDRQRRRVEGRSVRSLNMSEGFDPVDGYETDLSDVVHESVRNTPSEGWGQGRPHHDEGTPDDDSGGSAGVKRRRHLLASVLRSLDDNLHVNGECRHGEEAHNCPHCGTCQRYGIHLYDSTIHEGRVRGRRVLREELESHEQQVRLVFRNAVETLASNPTQVGVVTGSLSTIWDHLWDFQDTTDVSSLVDLLFQVSRTYVRETKLQETVFRILYSICVDQTSPGLLLVGTRVPDPIQHLHQVQQTHPASEVLHRLGELLVELLTRHNGGKGVLKTPATQRKQGNRGLSDHDMDSQPTFDGEDTVVSGGDTGGPSMTHVPYYDSSDIPLGAYSVGMSSDSLSEEREDLLDDSWDTDQGWEAVVVTAPDVRCPTLSRLATFAPGSSLEDMPVEGTGEDTTVDRDIEFEMSIPQMDGAAHSSNGSDVCEVGIPQMDGAGNTSVGSDRGTDFVYRVSTATYVGKDTQGGGMTYEEGTKRWSGMSAAERHRARVIGECAGVSIPTASKPIGNGQSLHSVTSLTLKQVEDLVSPSFLLSEPGRRVRNNVMKHVSFLAGEVAFRHGPGCTCDACQWSPTSSCKKTADSVLQLLKTSLAEGVQEPRSGGTTSWHIASVDGDGSCFFHSVVYLLSCEDASQRWSSRDLRDQVVSRLQCLRGGDHATIHVPESLVERVGSELMGPESPEGANAGQVEDLVERHVAPVSAVLTAVGGNTQDFVSNDGVLDLEPYISEVQRSGTYVGLDVVFLLSDILRRPIHVYQRARDTDPFNRIFEAPGGEEPVSLSPLSILYTAVDGTLGHFEPMISSGQFTIPQTTTAARWTQFQSAWHRMAPEVQHLSSDVSNAFDDEQFLLQNGRITVCRRSGRSRRPSARVQEATEARESSPGLTTTSNSRRRTLSKRICTVYQAYGLPCSLDPTTTNLELCSQFLVDNPLALGLGRLELGYSWNLCRTKTQLPKGIETMGRDELTSTAHSLGLALDVSSSPSVDLIRGLITNWCEQLVKNYRRNRDQLVSYVVRLEQSRTIDLEMEEATRTVCRSELHLCGIQTQESDGRTRSSYRESDSDATDWDRIKLHYRLVTGLKRHGVWDPSVFIRGEDLLVDEATAALLRLDSGEGLPPDQGDRDRIYNLPLGSDVTDQGRLSFSPLQLQRVYQKQEERVFKYFFGFEA